VRSRCASSYACLPVSAFGLLPAGTHPFGNRFKRNGNIVDGVFELDKVKHLPDAYHIIASMINYDPAKRPTAAQVWLRPPGLWMAPLC
jgi:serine/threonine-protein kinase/endoribonuclease IRE1